MKESNNSLRYSPLKIQQFKMWLEEMKEKGNTQFFEVFVDDFKVIPKTDAIEDFDKHEQYIDEETKKVTVLTYNTPGSNRYKQHIYLLKDKTQSVPQNQTLSGPEVEAKIDEKVSLAKERWDCEQVKKELEGKKGELNEAEEYIEKLKTIIAETEKKLQEAKSNGDFTAVLRELAPQFLSLKKNPSGNLSGSNQGEKKPEEEASFSKTSEEKPSLTQQEKNFIEFGKSLHSSFSQGEFSKLLSIIDAFAKDKTAIDPVMSLLNIENKQQKTKTQP